jgi:hypothetical protein
VKRSFVVTLDAQFVPEDEATGQQTEAAREVVRVAVQRAMPHGVHVTVTENRGLPLHPFNPQPAPRHG